MRPAKLTQEPAARTICAIAVVSAASAAVPPRCRTSTPARIATGPVVAGSLGSETHAQFSVIGDTVNLASRLTGLAPPGEIWLNAACAESLPDSLPVTPLEPVSVKGKEKPVAVYRLEC